MQYNIQEMLTMNSLYLKKTAKLTTEVAKLILIEGIISVGSSYLRDASKVNCNRAKDNLKQVSNLTRNAMSGQELPNWDDL